MKQLHFPHTGLLMIVLKGYGNGIPDHITQSKKSSVVLEENRPWSLEIDSKDQIDHQKDDQ